MSSIKRTAGLAAVVALGAGLAAVYAAGFPNRAAFVASGPKAEGVPVEAFEFGAGAGAPIGGDLKIEVWAQSPMLFSPVTMDIDPKGRVWVVEGANYGGGTNMGDGTSIVVIEDADGDGKAEKSHVFVAERVRAAPLGIAVFDNVIVLSATPSVIVYTDVDRDAKFDAAVDKREVFLTGFGGGGHDHTLHAVVPSPGGQWYLSYGNMGANVKTKDGRHLISGCYYGNAGDIGKRSSDGRLYVGGAAIRINPDGTGLAVVGHNLRNTHDMVVTSFGDVLHNDNDDPAHCRAGWLMEYGNIGYADLTDGSRSWEEVAKTWEETRPQLDDAPVGYTGVHGRDVPRISQSHWRENYPGTIPPGDVYGPGSPTGVTIIEGDELGAAYRGMYLSCDMVHKAVLAHRPTLSEAQIVMKRSGYLLSLKKESIGQFFLPTDVTVGTEGAIYLADFYSNTSRAASHASGTIYRITRKDGEPGGPMKRPTVDLETIDGQLAALASPNGGVRFVAATRLMETGEPAIEPVKAFFAAHSGNPFIAARAIWVLAKIGGTGRAFVENLLSGGDEQQRLVAYRALRLTAPAMLMEYAKTAAGDGSAAVRREVALSMRDVPFDSARDVLATLIAGYDGTNRWYLEAIGAAANGREKPVYDTLVRPAAKAKPYAEWDAKAKNLAWRLHTAEAVEDLDGVVRAQKPSIGEFRHLIYAYAFWADEADRADRERRVLAWADLPQFAVEDYQTTIREVYEKDIKAIPVTRLTQDYKVPEQFGTETKVSTPDVIAKLTGDVERGRAKAALCLVCHKIDGAGIAFGPDISGFGRQRPIEEIVGDMVDPSAKLSHGFEEPVRLRKGNHVAEGFMMNYSYHAGSLKIKTMGGQFLKFNFRNDGIGIEKLAGRSWMPSASKMGLSDQDVRDIAEYLKAR